MSVATELARHWRTELSHGVFRLFLHRGLAWRRAPGADMSRIGYPKARTENIKALVLNAVKRGAYEAERPPPSWSWMARSGGIEYLPLENVSWDWELGLERDDALRARVAPLRGCGAVEAADRAGFFVYDDRDRQAGRLWFDDAARDPAVKGGRLFLGDAEVYCALLGKPRNTGDVLGGYCVLAVAKAHRMRSTKFERIGIGFVAEWCVEFDPGSFSSVG